jgi:DEAD/DEAH box helicase
MLVYQFVIHPSVGPSIRQVLEALYRQKWNALDGLGALVMTPTRELAVQIFDELRRVGKRHEFSAGLLIGGKDVKEEQQRVSGAARPRQTDRQTDSASIACLLFSEGGHFLDGL